MTPDPHQILLFHNLRRVLEAAHGRGIEMAPLKGAHLIASVYPEDEDRGRMADVDFLVRERDWDRTCELLLELGFERRVNPDRPSTMEEFHEAGFLLEVGADQPILFEPHRQLVQPARHPIDYDALWERSRPSTFEGAPCRELAVEDHALHAVIHLMSHRFIGPGRGLRDLELLLREEGADVPAIVRRAREWKCARAAWLALSLLDEVAPDLDLARATDELAPAFPVRAALRWLVPDTGGFRFAHSGLRTEQALLWPWLIDDAVQGLRFAASYGGVRVRDLLEPGRATTGIEPAADEREKLLQLEQFFERRGSRDDVVAFYDELAPRYDELVPPAWRARFEAADEFIADAIGEVGTALELGVGSGRLLSKISAERRVGLDISGSMCREASKREVAVVRADQAAVPFREGFADAVVSGHASGRYTPLAEFLDQVAFALGDGGRFGVHLFTDRALCFGAVLRPWQGLSPWSAPPPPATCHNLPPWGETLELFERAELRVEGWLLYRNLPFSPYLFRLPSPALFDLANEAVLVGVRAPRS